MNTAIIVAAGEGQRFGGDKLRADLLGKPVVFHTLSVFESHPEIGEIVLVVSDPDDEFWNICTQFSKVTALIRGGSTRSESVEKGVASSKGELILVHNGVNPFVTNREIIEVIQAGKSSGCALVGHPVFSTLKQVDEKNIVQKTVERDLVYAAETPQVITRELFFRGQKKCEEQGIIPTDESMVAEQMGVSPKMILASPKNKKITTREDLDQFSSQSLSSRVGYGFDSHRFSQKVSLLKIGGIAIPAHAGFEANSDGDIALHALCNALSSAIGEGSLDTWASDMCVNGITDSEKYVAVVWKKVREKKFIIQNISIGFEGKKPKLEKYFDEMKKNLARICECNPDQIGLTATTGEGLSDCGKGEGMSATVFVSLIPGDL